MVLNERRMILVMGCDCDPLGFVASSRQGRPEDWIRTVRTLKVLMTRLQHVLPREQVPKVTFLIRSDTYMQEAFGEYAYCARVSYGFFDQLRSKGHEIGWHPHLWRWLGKWKADLQDNDFMRDCLVKGFNSLSEYFRVRSVRTGWDFMSNGVLETLESLGVQTDFSALPGIKYEDIAQGIRCDWLGAPETFYFPCRSDYRRPAVRAVFKVLEMPITLTESPRPISWVRPFIDRYRGARRSTARHEPLNIAKHPIFNKYGFERALADDRGEHPRYILSYFHPSDVANSGLFSMRYLETNIKYLSIRCKEERSQLITMTAKEAAEDFLKVRGIS